MSVLKQMIDKEGKEEAVGGNWTVKTEMGESPKPFLCLFRILSLGNLDPFHFSTDVSSIHKLFWSSDSEISLVDKRIFNLHCLDAFPINPWELILLRPPRDAVILILASEACFVASRVFFTPSTRDYRPPPPPSFDRVGLAVPPVLLPHLLCLVSCWQSVPLGELLCYSQLRAFPRYCNKSPSLSPPTCVLHVLLPGAQCVVFPHIIANWTLSTGDSWEKKSLSNQTRSRSIFFRDGDWHKWL